MESPKPTAAIEPAIQLLTGANRPGAAVNFAIAIRELGADSIADTIERARNFVESIDPTKLSMASGRTRNDIFGAFIIQDILEKFYCFAQETPQLAMMLPMVSKGIEAARAEKAAKG